MIVRINDTIVKGDINAMDKMNHGAVKCQLKYCVGIGASAGGVEALQELFRNMPLPLRLRKYSAALPTHPIQVPLSSLYSTCLLIP